MNDDRTKAFPDEFANEGMELRDWFAGQALSGLMVNMNHLIPERIAERVYAVADAMLKRSKQ